jgi:hypothetical protein
MNEMGFALRGVLKPPGEMLSPSRTTERYELREEELIYFLQKPQCGIQWQSPFVLNNFRLINTNHNSLSSGIYRVPRIVSIESFRIVAECQESCFSGDNHFRG